MVGRAGFEPATHWLKAKAFRDFHFFILSIVLIYKHSLGALFMLS